jgi:hypothetical protein
MQLNAGIRLRKRSALKQAGAMASIVVSPRIDGGANAMQSPAD